VELKHLRAFVVLAEELHFGRSAERLHIVQPALSAQIRALEKSLGAALFERDRHKVLLTEEGRLLLPEALATLAQAARAKDVVARSGTGQVGQLKVAFVSSVLAELLPRLLRTLNEQLPGIELELKDMPSPAQVDALRAGTLDFGLVRLPIQQSGLNTRLLFEEPLVVAMSVDDPLSAKASLEPRDLTDREMFVLARQFCPGLYDQMLVGFHLQGVTLRIGRELGEFTTMLALVASGLGLGIVPEKAASALPPGVVTRPLAIDLAGTGIAVAWNHVDNPRKQAFLQVLAQLYPAKA
jgi:DNA-binding transcriptional LysR family regulator